MPSSELFRSPAIPVRRLRGTRGCAGRLGQEGSDERPVALVLAELARLRDELKAALSEAQAEPGSGRVPPPAEPAGRIEALRAAHAIEPLPERTPKRRGQAAESPVTTRIRERTGISSPEPMADFLEFPAGPTPFPEGTRVNRFQEFKLTMFSFPRSLPLLGTVRKLVARSSPAPTH